MPNNIDVRVVTKLWEEKAERKRELENERERKRERSYKSLMKVPGAISAEYERFSRLPNSNPL
jgi:hypothetical protein